MALFQIEGKDVEPTPSDMDFKTADLHDNANRQNAAGLLVVDLVRSNIRSITYQWSAMTPAQLAAFYTQWGTQMFHQVTYHDPITNTMRTGTFYRGDVIGKAYMARNRRILLYRDCKLTLVER